MNNEGILIVDDEAIIREVVGTILKERGYNVLKARNSAEAQELFAKYNEHIVIVITDLRMPGGSGVELAKALRRVRADLPILFISGDGENPVRFGSLTDFLAKPFTRKTIVAAVGNLITQRLAVCP